MTVLTYGSSSPYEATPQLSWRLNRFVFRAVPPNAADTAFVLLTRHHHRPDRLSFDLYQSPNYWWIFCARNPFLRGDPIWDFVSGLEIMVPSREYLTRVLGS